jgi:hypothetical protein
METKIGTWYGKPVEELTKEELLEAFKFIAKEKERQDKEISSLGDDYFKLLADKKLGLK